MNSALALLQAGQAAERALNLVTRALNQHEGVMPRLDAAQLVSASRSLQCAALELERMAVGLPEPKRG